jgi:hypothetical protein
MPLSTLVFPQPAGAHTSTSLQSRAAASRATSSPRATIPGRRVGTYSFVATSTDPGGAVVEDAALTTSAPLLDRKHDSPWVILRAGW